jgi:hypothetical protein
MGRKKLDFDCKHCGDSTEVMHTPLYVDSYKGYFCNMECYKLKLEENKEKNGNGN